MATLHALLVGINEYKHLQSLTGCEGDIDRVNATLQKYWGDSLAGAPTILKSSEATRQNLIDSFRRTFESDGIQEGDIGLFYFSGHGGQEMAAEYFSKDSHTDLLENLACHDSELSTGANFIADKELRYLIHHATKRGLNLVTIFDCCHAGGNTRGILPEAKIRKRLAPKVAQRNWDQFIFAGTDLTEEMVKAQSIDDIIPEGRHIQIAACEAKQSAIEIEDEGGVFTSGLMDLISDFGGKINYYELNNQLQSYVRKRVNDQDPQLYIFTGPPSQSDRVEMLQAKLFTDFLSNGVSKRPLTTEIYYDSTKREWILNAGGVYGVTKNWKGQPQRIPVYAQDDLLGYMSIAKIHAGYSVLKNDEDIDVIKRENYASRIPSLLGTNLSVYLSDLDSVDKTDMAGKIEETDNISIAGEEASADICVHSTPNGLFLANCGNTKPLSAIQSGSEKSTQILKQLSAVKKWQFVKNIQNPNSELSQDCLRIEYRNGDEVKPFEEGFKFPINEPFSLEVHNTLDQPLYLSSIYLSSLFEIMPLTREKVIELENTKPWVQRFNSVTPEPFIEEFNWPEEPLHLLFIASTEPFNIELLIQAGLTPPSKVGFDRQTRGLSFEPEATLLDGWMTRIVKCRIPNSKYVEE